MGGGKSLKAGGKTSKMRQDPLLGLNLQGFNLQMTKTDKYGKYWNTNAGL